MVKILTTLIMTLLLLVEAGCAIHKSSQQVPAAFWQVNQQRVIVAEQFAAKPQIYKTIHEGLPEYRIRNPIATEFDHYVEQIDLAWYHAIPEQFVEQLTLHNLRATALQAPIKATHSEYKTIYKQTGAATLLVIHLDAIGAKREYFGFMPQGVPMAYCALSGELIDLQHDNTILWHYTAKVTEPVLEPWDQAPRYSNFTSALKLAVNTAMQELEDNFFSAH